MLRLNNIKYKITSSIDEDVLLLFAKEKICRLLHIKIDRIKEIGFIYLNIDARNDIYYIYHVYFNLSINEETKALNHPKIQKYEPLTLKIEKAKKKKSVLVVGMGPSGLFNAYILSLAGFDVTLIDRGKKISERVKDVENFFTNRILNEGSNIQFGEGGAGTFSDGKLNTGNRTPIVEVVNDIFIKHGAPKSIRYMAKPHIGTDILRKVIENIRETLVKNGVKIYFETRFVDFEIRKDIYVKFESSQIIDGNYDHVVLAIGHSAHDTYEMLYKKQILMIPKAFAVGLRIEHLQDDINQALYHEKKKYLPNASYKLVAHLNNGRAAYTFCMCPGGYVVNASSEKEHLVVNGMSNYARDGLNANSAVLVEVKPNDFYKNSPLDGLSFQKKLENDFFNVSKDYSVPVQTYKDFKNKTTSTEFGKVQPTIKPGYVFYDINKLFPSWLSNSLVEAIDNFSKNIKGFNDDEALLSGPETRTSCPLQIKRDQTYSCSIKNIHPIGEGSGYSGGIMTSAIDGIRCALKMIEETNNE